jgi:hypothetical protein
VPELLGFVGIALVALLTLFVALRWPSAGRLMTVALAFRVSVMLVGYFFTSLPDSGADAIRFEQLAWELAQYPFLELLGSAVRLDSYLISSVIAIFYSLLGRSLLLAQSISLLFGMGTIFMGWLLARKLWGDRAANMAGWILAVSPSLILYSTLTLREAYISFFLLVGLYGVVGCVQEGALKSLLLAISGFVGATLFHGGMAVGALLLLICSAIYSLYRTLRAALRCRLRPISAILLVMATVGMGVFFSGAISLPKLGRFNTATYPERLLNITAATTRGSGGEKGASYPEWTVPKTVPELFYKAPVRTIYFAFSPFPWDIGDSTQLIGMFDGLLHMGLTFLVWRNRKSIWSNRAGRVLLIILITYFITFGLAVGNYGSGIRHRSKFLPVLVVLATPLLPRRILLIKKKSLQKST